MQIGPLDIPEEILTALGENRLVIFAGAGVSIPPPSSLMSFAGLVEELLGRELQADEGGQLDRVLGRARDQGTPVHRRAAELLSKPDSHFNTLHSSLVGLFGTAAPLRIVTTNFDLHFEGAIHAHPDLGSVEIYNAPALPMGSSFKGLVHLHGALERTPEELVLTDADFGRAYLTEGWAGRFVVELFREYTVLFVGYSYADTVMNYLTRGLAPTVGRHRFALTESGQREKWELLGIQAIDYDPADDHRALAEGLEQWVAFERRGFLEWSRRLPELVGREPRALAPDEQGELEFCLSNPKRARLFYEHAKHPDWLRWADETGRLESLFSFEGDQESLWDLAHWFSQDPLGDRGKIALQIALKELRPVSPALSMVASQQMHRALSNQSTTETSEPTDPRRIAAWAILLIERTAPNYPPGHLDFWLEHLAPQDHAQLAAQILGHLLRCRPTFRKALPLGQGIDLGISLEWQRLADHLEYTWEKLRSDITALAWPLVPVITEILESRWRWQASIEATAPINDPWCWDRSWIEEPSGETEQHDRASGLLLDIGKDVLDELEANAAKKAAVVIESWLSASAPQLNLLGLYGLANSSKWTPNQKVGILAPKYLPATRPYKKESFGVLRKSYPQLSRRQREQFLKRTERLYHRQIVDREADQDRHRSAVYEWHNVLVWLNQAAPEDPVVEHALKNVHEIYPDFQPRRHPEIDLYSGEAVYVRPESHLEAEEIAKLSLAEWFRELERARERNTRHYRIDYVQGFLEETGRAASGWYDWGLPFAHELVKGQHFDHKVWRHLMTCWKKHSFRPREWTKLAKVIDHPQLLQAQVSEIMEMLAGRIKQEKPTASLPMLRKGLRLAEKLLPIAESTPYTILESEDWPLQAINHPGGVLAEMLVQTVGRLLGKNATKNCGIPLASKNLLDAIMAGKGKASSMGRVIIASNAHYFFWIDPGWTRERLLSNFSWNHDAARAVQAWHGFLTWGRFTTTLLQTLTPAATQLAYHLDRLGEHRDKYGKFIANAASSLPDDPFGKPWFQAFLEQANDDDRMQFAWKLEKILESLQPEQKSELWSSWLKHYLERRIEVPPEPEGKELEALFRWVFNLPEHLAEYVECLEALPGKGASANYLLLKLQQGDPASQDPNLIARLVLALLGHCDTIEYWNLSRLRAVIIRLHRENVDDHLVRELYEKYLEHGGPEDQELINVVSADNGP